MKSLEKYIPKISSKYVIIGLFTLFLILIIGAKLEKNSMIKIGNVIILSQNYNKKVEISLEERLKYESLIKEYTNQIDAAIESGNHEGLQEDRFIKKTENLEALGEWNKAIKTLYQGLYYFPKSQILREVLALTYDAVGEYKISIKYYENILQNYVDHRSDFQQRVIQLYIKLNDPEVAGKYYIDYMKMGGQKNLDLMNQIRALKGLSPLTGFKDVKIQE